MKNFFQTSLIILSLTLLLMFFLDRSYTYIFENGEPRSKIQSILQITRHYDVAFFGSSRTQNHIDCNLITQLTGKSCINLGISASSPGDMLILMKLAKVKNLTFNQVFMQVDYNYNNSGITKEFKANLVGPLIANPVVKEQLHKYKEDYIYGSMPFYYYMKFNRIIGIRGLTNSFLHRKQYLESDIEIGFSPLKGIGKEVAGSFPETIKYTSEELDQMQNFYKGTKTKLEFFTAPYCKEIRNRNFMDKVKLKLPELNNYIALFDEKDEYFFNCGHLNEAGAEIFTKILIEDFLQ